MGVFDHQEWTYDGAFEQLFGLGSGEFEQKFSQNSNARGVARGGGGGACLSFDLTGTLAARLLEDINFTQANEILENRDVQPFSLIMYFC